MSIIELKSIDEISENFEIFIFDIWGTIYDGEFLFPNEAIDRNQYDRMMI